MNHYSAQALRRLVPICPTCGKTALEVKTRFGLRNSCCGLWSWDRYPLVDEATHRARNEAHKAFDALWKEGILSRGDAYRRLREKMGMSKDECHMKIMNRHDAERVPGAASEIASEVKGECE